MLEHTAISLPIAVARVDDRAPLESLIPPGFWWFYLIGPPLLAVMFDPSVMRWNLELAWMSISMEAIHVAGIGLPLQAIYHFVLPRVMPRVSQPVLRHAIHAITIFVVVTVARLYLPPICDEVFPLKDRDPNRFFLLSYVTSAVVMLVAVTYQRLRETARRIERQAQGQRQAALAAQLRALQARTNPHFLFNSLNAIASLIGKDPVRAEAMVERLSDVLRYALERSRCQEVTVAEELAIVREYLDIERERFGPRLSWRIHAGEAVKRMKMPPMLLQPLVENAVLHGVGSKRGGGTVEVSVHALPDRLCLSVSDDGPGAGASKHAGTKTGLRDLEERLDLIFGRRDLLHFERAPAGGLCARVELPRTEQ